MADDATTSAFPEQPPFYLHFTPENLAALASDPPPDPSTLPHDSPLHYLTPPPLPPNNTYWSFGAFWQYPEQHPTLESASIRKLYTTPDDLLSSPNRTIELRRLAKSVLLCFVELVGLVAIAPEEFEQKAMDMQHMLFNMHHLINQYRPHQARETLCSVMEERLERVRRETEENRKAAKRVREVLAEVERLGQVVGEGKGEEGGGERRRRREREKWGRILEATKE